MATKKDLVEAYSFSRRRLVTAFLSGAPGGREVEPSRPGRTVVGGLALAVLLVAGGAIAAVLSPSTPAGWNENDGLIISKETGANYVNLKDAAGDAVLHPVLNPTSAQLILGPDPEPQIISQETIDAEGIGQTIGILNAPQTLPTTAQLIGTGWTSCTGDDLGMAVDLSERPRVSELAADRAFLVRTQVGQTTRAYVIAQADPRTSDRPRAYAYPIAVDADNLRSELGLTAFSIAEAPVVPSDWVQLLPLGGPLDWSSFGIRAAGQPWPGAAQAGLDGAEIGDYYLGSDGQGLVLTDTGAADLTPFAAAVYANTVVPGTGSAPRMAQGDIPAVPRIARPYEPASWPGALLTDAGGGEQCLVLGAAAGERPAVTLATQPTDSASAEEEAPAGQRHVSVASGFGAFVLSGDWGDEVGGAPFVIDQGGAAYAVSGDGTVAQMGYDLDAAPLVPDTWVGLFDAGVELSVDKARCPPSSDAEFVCS